jgi:hypothetical protein
MTSGSSLSPVVRALRGIAPLVGDLVAQVGGLRSPAGDGIRTKAPRGAPAAERDRVRRRIRVYSAAWLEVPAPVIDAWRIESGAIVGLCAHTTPAQAHEAARALATWLEERLPLLTEHALDALHRRPRHREAPPLHRPDDDVDDRRLPRLPLRAARHPAGVPRRRAARPLQELELRRRPRRGGVRPHRAPLRRHPRRRAARREGRSRPRPPRPEVPRHRDDRRRMTPTLLVVAVGLTITAAQVIAAGVRGWVGALQPEELPPTQPMRAGYRAGRALRIRRQAAIRARLSQHRQEPDR